MDNFHIGYEHSFGKQKRKPLENMPHPSPKRLKFSQATDVKPDDDLFFTLNFNDRRKSSTSNGKNVSKSKILFTSNQTTNKKETADRYSETWTPPFQERYNLSNQTTRPQQYSDRFPLEATSTVRNQVSMSPINLFKKGNIQFEEVLPPIDDPDLDLGIGDLKDILNNDTGDNLKTTKVVKQKQVSNVNQTYKRKPSTKAKGQPRQRSKTGKKAPNSRKPENGDIEDDAGLLQGQRGKSDKDLVLVKDYGLEKIFPFRTFNSLQSKCFDTLWNTTKNMIISAPTGSGKTVLFEIAIARNVIKEDFRGNYNFKVVYIAPIKTLCQQKFSEWEQKFSQLGLKMLELTGDTEITDFAQYESSNIIITTPEKWDSITRKWKDNYRMVSQISLLLIDEVHLLNTEERGATLEAVVSRMKIISKSEELKDCPASQLRIIAVSATIPNIVDLGEWLEVPQECVKEFGDEYRSTLIEKHVFGYNMPKNEFQFEKSLNYRLMEIIRKFSSGKPTLIFCQTQKGTVSACEQIIADMRTREFIKDELQLQKLVESSHSVSDKNLQRFITHGVAFHNAGMLYEDRRIVEDLFIENLVTVICTTSTLAMGVNLPARLVIIKSTLCYRGAGIGYNEYSPIEIEQMMGRAGRPQFDTHGVVVIMTEKKNVEKYKSQYILKDNLESHFFEQLAEHINAEISLRSIKSLDTVISYLKSTFFHIRLRKNPVKYGIKDGFSNPAAINDYLATISKDVIQELHKYEMIQYFANDGKVRPLELGIDMSRYYVSFISMKNLFEKHDKQDFQDLLNTLSESQEFEKFRSRQEERRSLSNLNTNIRFPITGAISSSSKKAYVLIQCALGNVAIDNWELKRQTNDIMNTSWKIMQCFKRFYSIKKLGQGLIHSIKLIKFISMRTWEDNSITLLKQLPGIGDKFAASLCEAKLDSFEKLLQAPPYLIEMACNKNPPFGVQTQKKVEMIPQLRVHLLQSSPQEIKFRVALAENASNKNDKSDSRSGFYYILEDKSHKVEAFRYISLDEGLRGGVSQILSVSNLKDLASPLYAYFINERYVGIDFCYTINENGTCFRGEGEDTIREDLIPEEIYDSGAKKKNKDQHLDIENLPKVSHNPAQNCSHRCKNKKQCKHACCKIGLEEGFHSNIQNTLSYQAFRSEQSDRDLIDENIEYIDALLETAGKGDLKNDLNMNPLDKYNPIFRKNAYQREAGNGNKKMQQTNLFSYLPAKKNDGLNAPANSRTEQFRGEDKELMQNEPSGYSVSLLERLGFSGEQNKNPVARGGANYKADPHEQFQQLFGNIFE